MELICIFMGIKRGKNRDLQRENLLPFQGFGVGYRIYLALLEQMLMGVSLVRGLP